MTKFCGEFQRIVMKLDNRQFLFVSYDLIGSFSNKDGDGRHEGLQKKYFYFIFKCTVNIQIILMSTSLDIVPWFNLSIA